MTPQEALQKAVGEYEDARKHLVEAYGWMSVPAHLYMVITGVGGLVIGFVVGLFF